MSCVGVATPKLPKTLSWKLAGCVAKLMICEAFRLPIWTVIFGSSTTSG